MRRSIGSRERQSLFLLAGLLLAGYCPAPITFEPPVEPAKIQVVRALQAIEVDGTLDEDSWAKATPVTAFVQKDPVQGQAVSELTEARILFEDEYLYVGAFCRNANGKDDIRAQNLQRDFNYFQNDLFGIAIDGFLDQHNCMAFQTTPYGTQRKILVMDDPFFNREWSGLWKLRTQITDTGWTAGLALNPRVQLITFFQFNTTNERSTLNSRLAWEYRSLSYIYLVYNDNRQIPGPGTRHYESAERAAGDF